MDSFSYRVLLQVYVSYSWVIAYYCNLQNDTLGSQFFPYANIIRRHDSAVSWACYKLFQFGLTSRYMYLLLLNIIIKVRSPLHDMLRRTNVYRIYMEIQRRNKTGESTPTLGIYTPEHLSNHAANFYPHHTLLLI